VAEQGGAGSTLGPLEAEVMAVLWHSGKPLPVREVAAEIAVRGVLAEFGDAALARFVERAELDPRLRERLRRLMEQQ